MRRIVQFGCDESTLVGTVDEAPGSTGVLIVSGGNEVRCGAHRGMALLGGRLAVDGVPVFRFDRRGVGDSEGDNGGYASSSPDIAAALAAFRREQPHLVRILGFGNCDAATALLLFDHGCDALLLANPWLGDEAAALPPAAVRAHYLRRFLDPAAWRKLFRKGKVRNALSQSFGKTPQQPLAKRIAFALAARPTIILLAAGDRTAQVFAGSMTLPASVRMMRIDTASHSFAGEDEAVARAVTAAVRDLDDFRGA